MIVPVQWVQKRLKHPDVNGVDRHLLKNLVLGDRGGSVANPVGNGIGLHANEPRSWPSAKTNW